MFKNALLSIKKNIGKTLLLLLLMIVIANLIIAGLSIKSATSKSMDSVKESLGTDVTLSYNMKNIMGERGKGESVDSVMQSITVEMADSLKDLDYVDHYNYVVSVNASSDDIDPVSMQSSDSGNNTDNNNQQGDMPTFMNQSDFSVSGNTTMEYLSDFVNENYNLSSGRLLSADDNDTTNCVIESNLATDNDLEVGSTFTITSTVDDEEISVELTVVGIFTFETSNDMGNMMDNASSPINTIYTSLSTAQKLNGSTTNLTSATFYLDSIDHIDAFKTLADEKTDIDFDTYTLDTSNMDYQRNVSSLESIESFASLFLIIVIGAGSVILCLILVLTIRNRFYEFGVMLSLGQSKAKIILQQLLEIAIIATLAICVSLTTGKMVSNVISHMIVSNQSDEVVMNMDEKDGNQPDNNQSDDNQPDDNQDKNLAEQMSKPASEELDVSLTGDTVIKLIEISGLICVLSITIPSIYILRLSPRELLIKKEG